MTSTAKENDLQHHVMDEFYAFTILWLAVVDQAFDTWEVDGEIK